MGQTQLEQDVWPPSHWAALWWHTCLRMAGLFRWEAAGRKLRGPHVRAGLAPLQWALPSRTQSWLNLVKLVETQPQRRAQASHTTPAAPWGESLLITEEHGEGVALLGHP